PDRVPQIYLRIRAVTDTGLLITAGLLFVSGSTIVSLIYDPRYWEAGWILRFLSFGLVFSRYSVAQQAYLAYCRPDYISILSFTKLASLFGLVPLLYYLFGLMGAVLGIAFHMLPCAVWTFYLNMRFGLNSIRLELGVVAGWLAGCLLGLVFNGLVGH